MVKESGLEASKNELATVSFCISAVSGTSEDEDTRLSKCVRGIEVLGM